MRSGYCLEETRNALRSGDRNRNTDLNHVQGRIGVDVVSNSNENYQFLVNRADESKRPAGSAHRNSTSSLSLDPQNSDSKGNGLLSIALIGPNEENRNTMASILAECSVRTVREFSSYPLSLDDPPNPLGRPYDVIIIDLDGDLDYSLELVENLCATESTVVMVYSSNADQDLVVRCMRAGAREFILPPFEKKAVAEALQRASTALRSGSRQAKKTRGKLLVFFGAKGGSGVTTIACNLSMALTQEAGQSALLIDLGLPLGDAALNLGIVSEYSTDNALEDVDRLDATFLSKLLVKHRSGISVLAAPTKVPKVQPSHEAISKLMSAARVDFENVIVDVGSRLDLMGSALFKDASTIYLVTQAGISELRNSHRMISEFFNAGGPKLEVVINRFEPASQGLTEEHITKALDRPVQWKIPDDYAVARQMQNTGLASLTDSPISRVIRQMARSICGLPAMPEKRKGFTLKSLGRSTAETIATAGEPLSVPSETPVLTWSTPSPITSGTRLSTTQLDASASVPGTFVYTPGVGYGLPPGTHTLWVTFTPEDGSGSAPVQVSVSITVTRAIPTINWPIPPEVPFGAALSDAQLNATASVPGTFAYRPAAGEILTTGAHTLSVTFTPTDAANYDTAEATVSVRVARATPTLEWPTPDPIARGVALSKVQLNATASVPGTFVYTPGDGELLKGGSHTLSVEFTPKDIDGYAPIKATVSLNVTKATPTIAWSAPARITYGTKLGAAQLNATASVPGTFVYTPGEGAMLAVGAHTPFVTFTPDDTTDYTPARAAVSLTVVPKMSVVTWERPAPIPDGSPLGAAQLNATASVPGTFVYDPVAGHVFSSGTHVLSTTFTPMDTENYTTEQATVWITVAKADPIEMTWQDPAAICYGTPLGASELNARASVPGTFAYTPAAGCVLPPGKHTLRVTFTPNDVAHCATAQATVALLVEELPNFASMLPSGPHAPSIPADAVDSTGPDNTGPESLPGDRAENQKFEPETRTYKGATYEKGEDRQWHLQRQ
jgi:Flp pilus assembly CpaE family ATPase